MHIEPPEKEAFAAGDFAAERGGYPVRDLVELVTAGEYVVVDVETEH